MEDPQPISAHLPAAQTPGDMARSERPLSQWVLKRQWHFDEYHPALKPLLPAVMRFASDVMRHRVHSITPYWLTFLGPSGIGKTFLLEQLFKCLADNIERWPILTGSDGSERGARCAHIKPAADLDDFEAPADFGRYDLIYAEDVGAMGNKGSGAVITDRTVELLLHRPRRWTLIDANLTLEEMAATLDARVVSRLKRDGSVLIELPNEIPDYNFR